MQDDKIISLLRAIDKKLCALSASDVKEEIPVLANGCDQIVSAIVNGVFQTVPHPDTVQKVQSCTITYKDRPICINTVNNEIWNAVEREGSDGSLIYLDSDVSPMQDITLIMSSIRHNGQCNCCEDKKQPIVFLNKTYSKSILGRSGCPDKFLISGDIRWRVIIYLNGTLVFSSPFSPILTSQTQAISWLNANTNNIWYGATDGQLVEYNFPEINSGEYYMVINETTNGMSNACEQGLSSNLFFGFTNNGISFGANCAIADALPQDDTWNNRAGWFWAC